MRNCTAKSLAQARIAARVSSLRSTAVNTVLAEVKQIQASGRDLVSLLPELHDL